MMRFQTSKKMLLAAVLASGATVALAQNSGVMGEGRPGSPSKAGSGMSNTPTTPPAMANPPANNDQTTRTQENRGSSGTMGTRNGNDKRNGGTAAAGSGVNNTPTTPPAMANPPTPKASDSNSPDKNTMGSGR